MTRAVPFHNRSLDQRLSFRAVARNPSLERRVLSGLLRSLCALAMTSMGRAVLTLSLHDVRLLVEGEGRFGEKPKQGEVRLRFVQKDKD